MGLVGSGFRLKDMLKNSHEKKTLPDGSWMRIAVVAAKYNRQITDAMVESAEAVLKECKVAQVKVFRVPGIFEIPLTLRYLLKHEAYDGAVALGCVIRGETGHFDQIVSSCTRGIEGVSLDSGIPVGHGILAVDNEDQALVRCRIGGDHDRAAEAALAVVELARLFKDISDGR